MSDQSPDSEETIAENQQEAKEKAVDTAENGVEVSETSEVEDLQNQLKESNEKYLRSEAEMQNLRRRVERDIENARKYALEKFVSDLLPVADNLERSLAALPDDEQQKAVREGIELTHKSLLDVLAKFSVEAVDPKDQTFNPEIHQAMAMIENADVPPNTVIEVFQKGYTLNGRLVRPAMVVVSKAPAE